jgi:hypothetical protein
LADSQSDRALAVAAGLAEPPERSLLLQARAKIVLSPARSDLLTEDIEDLHTCGGNGWPGIAIDGSLRDQLSTAAAVMIRSFARQLPGLGQSSFDYLWRNILSGDSMIKTVPSQILVELATRPLAIVLRMAGLHEMHFKLPWSADTEVVVRFDPQ